MPLLPFTGFQSAGHQPAEIKQAKLAVLIDADNTQPGIIEGLLDEVAKYGIASVKRITHGNPDILPGRKKHKRRLSCPGSFIPY